MPSLELRKAQHVLNTTPANPSTDLPQWGELRRELERGRGGTQTDAIDKWDTTWY
jgi:hypothetical protein